MLTVELTVHQHIIDVDQFLGRVEQVFDDFFLTLALLNWSTIQYDWDSVPDQLDRSLLIKTLVDFLNHQTTILL